MKFTDEVDNLVRKHEVLTKVIAELKVLAKKDEAEEKFGEKVKEGRLVVSEIHEGFMEIEAEIFKTDFEPFKEKLSEFVDLVGDDIPKKIGEVIDEASNFLKKFK